MLSDGRRWVDGRTEAVPWWRRLAHWSRTREGVAFLLLLALALALRLVFAPSPGVLNDLSQYISWGRLENNHFWRFYSVTARQLFFANYPPLTIYLLGVLVKLYTLLGGHTISEQAPALAALVKLPAILADLGAVALMYRIARVRLSAVAALLVAASYALCPAVILDGAFWGQMDAIFVLALLGALFGALRGRAVTAGVLFAAAILLKPQPVVFAPLLMVYLWRWSGSKQALRAAAAICAVSVLVCLPYLLPPAFEMTHFVGNVLANMRRFPYTSFNGYNFWWLVGAASQPSGTHLLGPLSPTLIGDALFLAVLALVLAAVWRDGSPACLLGVAALIATSFFVLTAQQHERYLFPALALFVVAALYDRRAWPAYAVAYVTVSLNIGVVILQSADYGGLFTRLRTLLNTTTFVQGFVSLTNVALLVYAAVLVAPPLVRRPAHTLLPDAPLAGVRRHAAP